MAGVEVDKNLKMKNRNKIIGGVVILVILVVSLVAGIAWTMRPQASESGLKNAVVAYAGGTCEAAIFVAYEKGFFTEEGLNVTLIQNWGTDREVAMDAGTIDAGVASFEFLKPIEQGFNIKLTAGIHTGCISVVAPANSTIKTIADLKGKVVGVDAIGLGASQIVLSIKLRELGIDPTTEITWRAYPGVQLDEAVSKGEIAAYATWDPVPAEAVANEGYISLLNIADDAPFNTTYCCFVGISGKTVADDPAKAAALTKAILKASEWVQEHPLETAQIEVNNNFVGGTVALNEALLASYNSTPSISQAEASVRWWITQQQAVGVFDTGTNADALYNRTFAQVITDSQIPSI